MSTYPTIHAMRYSIPVIQQKIEVAVVTAAIAIQNEDPSTTDHTNRLRWANWVVRNSSAAWNPFAWPVAMNTTIQGEVTNDPSGNSVADSDVQFVVNSNVEAVVTVWIANPPAGA